MKTIQEYLKEQLYQDLSYTYNNVEESGGLYDGQIELATYIINNIQDSLKDKYEFSGNNLIGNNLIGNNLSFNNVYFNKLIIYVKYFDADIQNINIRASIDFLTSSNRWDDFKKYNFDKDTNKLDNITIDINCPKQVDKYYNIIRGKISHELNHGYIYWEILKDDFSEQNIVPQEYHNRLHDWKNKIYNKITKHINNPTNNEAEQICYNLVYTLTRYERNAFLSEIITYLYDNKGLFKSLSNIQNELDKSAQYNLYTNEGPQIIDIIKKYWSNDKKIILSNTYNEIYNTKYSVNKVIKLLEFKIEETIKKINKNIDILCKKYKDDILNENISYIYFENNIDWF